MVDTISRLEESRDSPLSRTAEFHASFRSIGASNADDGSTPTNSGIDFRNKKMASTDSSERRTITLLSQTPHEVTRPFPEASQFAKIKTSLLAAQPTRSSLQSALNAAEVRLEKDISTTSMQRDKAEKEIERIHEEREMGRKLWRKTLEKVEGEEGREARERWEDRVGGGDKMEE